MTRRIPQYNAGAQETNAGKDPLDDATDRVRVGGQVAVGSAEDQDRGGGGAETNERVRPETRGFSVELAIQTEERADNQGGAQTQGGFFIPA